MYTSYIVIFAVVFLIVGLTSVIANIATWKLNEADAKELFSKESLNSYEEELSESLRRFNIVATDYSSATELASALGYNVIQDKHLKVGVEATLHERDIRVNSSLGEKSQNFSIAHELAHILRGSTEETIETRLTHSPLKRRPKEEQICDYWAASILLPKDYMKNNLKKARYSQMTSSERKAFVKRISEEKDVHQDMVIRRIKEMAWLE